MKLQWLGLLLLVVLAACSRESVQGTLTRQDFGTASDDVAWDVAAPKGGVGAVVVGYSRGDLDGVNKGGLDAFIRKYDGGTVWAWQFGTRNTDEATDVAVTATGISYVVGHTNGALGFKVGSRDVFLRKYDAAGVLQWTRQFGTTSSDAAKDVTLDSSGNVYVLSVDNGTAFRVRKFNASGSLSQTITNDSINVSSPTALAVDSTGNIFVIARFSSNIARLFKYNSAGALLASPDVLTSTGSVVPSDLIVDSSNNLYFSATDSGANRGGVVKKVNNAGVSLWTHSVEPAAVNTPNTDAFPFALALGAQGNVFVTGDTTGAYTGFTNAGGRDIFVLLLNGANGSRFWTRQIGQSGSDNARGIAVSDAVYVAGYSNSNPNLLGDTNYCNCTISNDAFLVQLDAFSGNLLGIDQ